MDNEARKQALDALSRLLKRMQGYRDRLDLAGDAFDKDAEEIRAALQPTGEKSDLQDCDCKNCRAHHPEQCVQPTSPMGDVDKDAALKACVFDSMHQSGFGHELIKWDTAQIYEGARRMFDYIAERAILSRATSAGVDLQKVREGILGALNQPDPMTPQAYDKMMDGLQESLSIIDRIAPQSAAGWKLVPEELSVQRDGPLYYLLSEAGFKTFIAADDFWQKLLSAAPQPQSKGWGMLTSYECPNCGFRMSSMDKPCLYCASKAQVPATPPARDEREGM